MSIETIRIKVGTTFDFDLTDKLGQVVLKAGRAFDEAIRTRLLADGIDTVTILFMPDRQNTNRILLESYPRDAVVRFQNIIAQTEQSLQVLVEEIMRNRRARSDVLYSQLDRFLGDVVENTATALGVLAARWNSDLNSEDAKLIARSTRLGWLAMLTGRELGMNSTDLVSLGLAGLLHDLSLFRHTEWRDPIYRIQRRQEFVAAYQRHPVESVEMLNGAAGLSSQVLLMIAQVHEQSNGSGFPRGLRGTRILPGARILNVVDAYLEIADPTFRKDGIVPADALAHICFHAVQGVFDRRATKSFISVLSAYPIGTEVDLEDASHGVVVGSNPGKPLDPLIRLIDGSHEITDLLNAKIRIDAPKPGGGGMRRLQPKKEMSVPFWDATESGDSDQ